MRAQRRSRQAVDHILCVGLRGTQALAVATHTQAWSGGSLSRNNSAVFCVATHTQAWSGGLGNSPKLRVV